MRLLDLFCGAGGAAMGYHRVGFDDIVGIDIHPQPNYPFRFIQGDALSLEAWLDINVFKWDLIHASPPCQGYSTQTRNRSKHPRLIEKTRSLLKESDVSYVIENVEGARKELQEPTRLCGSMFELCVRRHRYFETSFYVDGEQCRHDLQTPRFRSLDQKMVTAGKLASVVGVHGHINYPGEFELRKMAMGIDWMTNAELVEAIPPAYTEYIGRQFLSNKSEVAA